MTPADSDDAGYETGHQTGFDPGYDSGYETGYDPGYGYDASNEAEPGWQASGFADLGGSQQSRRRRAKAQAAHSRRSRRAERAAANAEKIAMRRAQAALRRGVQPPKLLGPYAGRNYHKLRLPAHMETTAQIAGIYPFVVDSGLDAPGMYIGRHVWSGNSFDFDVFELYRQQVIENPNFAVFGAVGSRKSALLKTLISRGSAFGYQAAVPCDPKGEYTRLARRLGCEPTYIGPGLSTRLNPLDAPPRPRGIADADWAREVKRARSSLLSSLIETAKGVPLTPAEHTAVDLALDVVTRQITGAAPDRWATPLLPHVLEAMTDPTEEDCAALPMTATELRDASRDATLTLRRLTHGALGGLFDGPTTSPLDFDRPIAVLNLERVQGSDEMIALIMTCAQAWMEAALMRQDGVQRYVVYDECWRLMRFAGLVRRLSAQQKLARQWGCANAIVAHRISDLLSASPDSVEIAKGLLAETAIRILYKQASDQIADTQEALGLTDVAADLLPRLDPGYALWLIQHRAFYVEHVVGDLEIPVVLNGSKMHGEVDDTNLVPDDLDPSELDPPELVPAPWRDGADHGHDPAEEDEENLVAGPRWSAPPLVREGLHHIQVGDPHVPGEATPPPTYHGMGQPPAGGAGAHH
ncbi:conjugal transfer protein TraC [Parafrankia colletiae]|uniref:Conjugal transfer protein TraC n=1 Tax=Parafrankia colletiae TaxID=573497 RepID=A0A1S1QUF9_9ACTN|nr:conjugal transfer protein TraC [Parafrankia colletiae]MCK9898859.1 conjugal transfer protein TraC [Frankia sp. Cpl3]OHV38333.1 conjugal transfer protein TraC [Parafrankia colletiae]